MLNQDSAVTIRGRRIHTRRDCLVSAPKAQMLVYASMENVEHLSKNKVNAGIFWLRTGFQLSVVHTLLLTKCTKHQDILIVISITKRAQQNILILSITVERMQWKLTLSVPRCLSYLSHSSIYMMLHEKRYNKENSVENATFNSQ